MRHLYLIGSLTLVLFSGCISTRSATSVTTYRGIPVIMISGTIDRKAARRVIRELRVASRQSPSAIVVGIDTPGGHLSACESLARALTEVSPPVYALVDDGVAGGAMVVLAADHIFLKPEGLIGDAMPVLSPLNVNMDEAIVAKMTSDIELKMAAIASQNGHNPDIARCMVNRHRELTVQGKVISKKGVPLCLTAEEAKAVGLSEGTVESPQALVDMILEINEEQN